MHRIAYYVTGHGFGHATRTGAIIRAILKGDPRASVEIVSSVPSWIFAELDVFGPRVAFRSKASDVGLIQTDGLSIDFAASASALRAYLARFDETVEEEARHLGQEAIDLVMSDVPALPIAAAVRAAIPSIAVSNFSWDFIYRAYADRDPVFAAASSRSARAYGEATLLLRLPFAAPMNAFARAEDVPLVVRHARHSREETRRALGFGDRRPIVLICFGGLGIPGLDVHPLFEQRRANILAFGPDPSESRDPVRFVGNHEFYFPDLVNVADVVVSKPGYGLLSEAIAHQTSFLYAPRDDFAETPYLVRALETELRSAPTTLDALASGRFLDEALALVADKAERPARPTDGAGEVARRVRAMFAETTRRSGGGGARD